MKKTIILFIFYTAIVFNETAQTITCNRITPLTHNEEDSRPMKANDGTYYMTYFSDSTGSENIWITRSLDGGITWDSSWIAIQSTNSNLYPNMLQASNGTFHLVWFRTDQSTGYFNVWYSQSSDAINWNTPVMLTNNSFFNWVPNLLIDYDDNLWVTWASGITGNLDLLSIRSTDGGNTWSNPVQLTTSTQQDNMPYLFQRADSSFILTWQHYAGTGFPYMTDSCEIYYKVSADGINWSTENNITADSGPYYTDVFPCVYEDVYNNELYFTWTTTRFSPSFGSNVTLALSDILNGSTGAQSVEITCEGYFPRVIPADNPGQFLMVWVANPDHDTLNLHDIYSTFLNNNSVDIIEATVDLSPVKLFPNPFDQHTTIEFSNSKNEKYSLKLFDVFGRLVRTTNNITTGTIELERENLIRGYYFFQLQTDKQIISTGKLMIE